MRTSRKELRTRLRALKRWKREERVDTDTNGDENGRLNNFISFLFVCLSCVPLLNPFLLLYNLNNAAPTEPLDKSENSTPQVLNIAMASTLCASWKVPWTTAQWDSQAVAIAQLLSLHMHAHSPTHQAFSHVAAGQTPTTSSWTQSDTLWPHVSPPCGLLFDSRSSTFLGQGQLSFNVVDSLLTCGPPLTTLAMSIGRIGAYRGPMRLGCEFGRSGSRRTP